MSASSSTRLIAEDTRLSPLALSSAKTSSADQSLKRERAGARPLVSSWISLLAVAGFLGVYPSLSKLLEIWMTDPLRSIGIFILPTSIALIIYVWRQSDWEMRGSWWGLLLVGLSFAPLMFGGRLDFFWLVGGVRVNLLPSVLPICLYTGGTILLFSGARVLRMAWFPLALLLCIQPVPDAFVRFLDLPMQGISAHIARSFANLLGFPPTNAELLRLMFAPDFGMFIAPGCDGMRGAITLGYGALILGYLKRLSLLKWFTYVAGALLLGQLFNLIRLCALVVYYRVALGHPILENAAKQADYAIGAVLFLMAASLFLWVLIGKQREAGAASVAANSSEVYHANDWRLTQLRAAVLAVVVLVASVPAVRAIRISSENLAWATRQGEFSATELNSRIPTQVGAFRLVRVWQEHLNGNLVSENAAFEKAPSDEIELGIWLAPSGHTIQQSMAAHGETPKSSAIQWFSTAGEQDVAFETALYDNGFTDTFTGNTYCSPTSCQSGRLKPKDGVHLEISKTVDYTTRGQRVVPIFFKMQAPHADSGSEAEYKALLTECEDFLSHLDLTQLSQSFQ